MAHTFNGPYPLQLSRKGLSVWLFEQKEDGMYLRYIESMSHRCITTEGRNGNVYLSKGPRYTDREIQGYNWDLAASELGSVTGFGQEKAVPIQLVKVDPSPQLVTDADGLHIGVVWSDQPGYYIQSEDGRYLTISMEREYIG